MAKKNRPETMLNKRTSRNYFRIRAALEQKEMEANLKEIKTRYVSGIITEQEYKTLLNYYQNVKRSAQETEKKKYTYKPKKKKKKRVPAGCDMVQRSGTTKRKRSPAQTAQAVQKKPKEK